MLGLILFVCKMSSLINVCGYNAITLHDGRTLIVTKYVEWSLCSPLWSYMILDGYQCNPIDSFQGMIFSMSFCICGVGTALANLFWLKLYLCCQGILSCLIVLRLLWLVAVKPPHESRLSRMNLVMTSITYPMFLLTWGLGQDCYGVITHESEMIVTASLSIGMKSLAVLYVLTDEEYLSYANLIWEIPNNVFMVVRGVLLNIH